MLTLFARNANIYNDEDAIATIPFFSWIAVLYIAMLLMFSEVIFVIFIDYIYALTTFAVFSHFTGLQKRTPVLLYTLVRLFIDLLA